MYIHWEKDVFHEYTTKVEAFMEKGVHGRAQTAGPGELRSQRNKKARDFTHPFFPKSTLLSTCTELH